MRKKLAVTAIIVLIGLLIVCGIGFKNYFKNDNSYSFTWHENVSVKAGVPSIGKAASDFTIKEDGEYALGIRWMPVGVSVDDFKDLKPSDYSFVTGVVITSKSGKHIYATTGGYMTIDTVVELEAGDYEIEYVLLADREAYIDFADKYFGSVMSEELADFFEWDSFTKDRDLVMSYGLRVDEYRHVTGLQVLMILCILIAACLVFVILFWIVTDGKMQGLKYDERQEIERGRGFRYACYSMMAYLLGMFIFDAVDLIPRQYITVFYIGSLALGATVYAVYAIWHDCYFAMNENRKRSIIIIGILGLINLAIGISAMIFNKDIQYGVLGRTSGANLVVAVMFLVIAVTMILKNAFLARQAEADETEGDE